MCIKLTSSDYFQKIFFVNFFDPGPCEKFHVSISSCIFKCFSLFSSVSNQCIVCDS